MTIQVRIHNRSPTTLKNMEPTTALHTISALYSAYSLTCAQLTLLLFKGLMVALWYLGLEPYKLLSHMTTEWGIQWFFMMSFTYLKPQITWFPLPNGQRKKMTIAASYCVANIPYLYGTTTPKTNIFTIHLFAKYPSFRSMKTVKHTSSSTQHIHPLLWTKTYWCWMVYIVPILQELSTWTTNPPKFTPILLKYNQFPPDQLSGTTTPSVSKYKSSPDT